MRTGIFLNYAGGFLEAVDEVVELEKVGVDIALVAEAYSFDAISQLGFLAAKTSRIELGSGVVPIYIRTPSLLAMTAAGLDYVSDGRFRLGIGTSGPQVMEGFHGVPFDAPLGRTREVVEICRQVWRRENVQFDGKHYQIPLPADRGTGLGKPLHLINHPVRERIPITIAALGPKNVELTAEIAEGWQPVFFYPEKADEAWGDALRAGMAKRDPDLGPLDVMVSATLAIGDDVEDRLAWAKPQLALYIGGMGARGKNFYHNLATRYGFGDVANHIQDLYLSGRKAEAIDAVPDELVRHVSLIGPTGFVKERVAAYAEAGVTTTARASADRRPPRIRALRRGAEGSTALAVTAGPEEARTSSDMADLPLDTQERLELCDLLAELGPAVPTLLDGWTATDLAAHIVLRERDLVAGPCIVLPGPFQRFAERRRVRLAESKDFAWLVARIRSGPPIGFFRIGWVAPSELNEFFVHHEDVRRANGTGPRTPHACNGCRLVAKRSSQRPLPESTATHVPASRLSGPEPTSR